MNIAHPAATNTFEIEIVQNLLEDNKNNIVNNLGSTGGITFMITYYGEIGAPVATKKHQVQRKIAQAVFA